MIVKRLKLLGNVPMVDKVPLPLIVLGNLCNRMSIFYFIVICFFKICFLIFDLFLFLLYFIQS